jgi:tRNA(Ile)-lysidine synthase
MRNWIGTITRYRLIKRGDKILAGVSGGPDSLALLIILAGLKSRMEFSLHIAHVDHNLRGNSRDDALFVGRWAKKLGVPISVTTLDPKLKESKGSLEEVYRNARFDFLIKTAKRIGANKIALGHNLDDQAETILMRLIRGTGLSGLAGISVKRTIRNLVFIRPLLETRRDQIELFLKHRKVKPRIDPTNRQDLFLRNRIRLGLIPMLKKKYNRNITEVLANLAESISYDYEYLDKAARGKMRGSILRLDTGKLKKLHPAIMRLKMRQSIAHLKGDTRRITFRHIRELEELIFNRPAGSIVDLPKGVSIRKTRKALCFYKR